MQPASDPVSPRARPIHPLPKRRLRERLSPEVADSITYPPCNLSTSFLHCPSYSPLPDSFRKLPTTYNQSSIYSTTQRLRTQALNASSRSRATTAAADNSDASEDAVASHATPSLSISAASTTSVSPRPAGRRYSHPLGLAMAPQPIASTGVAKSKADKTTVDGYDALDNSNNKKKRKIPMMGESSVVASSATRADAQLMDGSASRSVSDETTISDNSNESYGLDPPVLHSTISLGLSHSKGVSGPGRGMFGRSRNPRAPHRTQANPSAHIWPDHRMTGIGPVPAAAMGVGNSEKILRHAWANPANTENRPGIISNAIAMAEKLQAPSGQENISLLAQHTSETKTTPAETQFTFTCESPDSGTVKWPGSDVPVSTYDDRYASASAAYHAAPHDAHRQNSQPVSQPVVAAKTATTTTESTAAATEPKEPAVSALEQQRQERRKNRRALDKELTTQARDRRFQARRKMAKSPPSIEDEYICLFCDYEAIFGEPPRYLIRSFEMRARNERIDEEKKRRRLEQVKARNRKGKKGSAKASAKNNATSANKNGEPQHDDIDGDETQSHDDSNLDEDDNGYDDDDDEEEEEDVEEAETDEESYHMDSSEEGDVEDAQLEDEFGGTVHAKIRDMTVTTHEPGGGISRHRYLIKS